MPEAAAKKLIALGMVQLQDSLQAMSIKIRIPTLLRKFTSNQDIIVVTADTVQGAMVMLQARYPGLKERLSDEQGALRRFVNVYVNEEDIRFLQDQQTPLKDGDEISIIPAIAGG
jgi:MoaD family protein